MEITPQERALINAYQRGFPLTPRPFARVGEELGLSEENVLEMLTDLTVKGVLSRVGAVVAPNRAGVSTLAAMEVPAERLDDVSALVSAHKEVNHNYEREHRLNLWFVATAPDAGKLADLLSDIAAETGFKVIDLPLVEAYHIDLGFPV
tara:strand:- start:176 stop:622 length:447 start_codon:yes stop_codon:yes gene_type:complete